MALSRRASSRFAASIWPGFVDAMTALILVLFFVLSIFMIVQFVLRDTISGQETELDQQDEQLDQLTLQVANLADALGLERTRADTQEELAATLTGERRAAEARIDSLLQDRSAAEAEIAALTGESEAADARISAFEAQVASLIAQNTDVSDRLSAAERQGAERLSQKEALDLALATARGEIDASAQAARLAAAKREALEALTASLREDAAGLQGEIDDLRDASQAHAGVLDEAEAARLAQAGALDEAEAARLAEAAAAEALRDRLADADAELTAMTLNLEAERKKAEETLLLLAAADAARTLLEGEQAEALSERDRQEAEIAQARALLGQEKEISQEGQKQMALLNQQTSELRSQLDALQGLLDASELSEVASQVQIETLGSNLNAALARVAAEENARAELETRERERLEEEAKDLRRYRSEFFGRISEILGEREGVQVAGDRFVFPSEVLFAPGSATLGPEGRAQIARVAGVIRDVAGEIPEEIDWVLRVDGHTDATPLGSGSEFSDNWDLSQARALSVVRYMIDGQGLPAKRLAATGFGEFQPVDSGTDRTALARNRRIELKFTER